MHMGHTQHLGSGQWAMGSGQWAVGGGVVGFVAVSLFGRIGSTHTVTPLPSLFVDPSSHQSQWHSAYSPPTDQQLFCHQHARASAAQKASTHSALPLPLPSSSAAAAAAASSFGLGAWALGIGRLGGWTDGATDDGSVRHHRACHAAPCPQGTGRLLSGCLSACTLSTRTHPPRRCLSPLHSP